MQDMKALRILLLLSFVSVYAMYPCHPSIRVLGPGMLEDEKKNF